MNPIFRLLWGDAGEAAMLAAQLDSSAWQAIDRQAAQHRLRPMLHRRATAGAWPLPDEIKRQWQDRHQRAAMRTLRQKAALVRIGKAFAAHGIAAALLKGGAFVWTSGIDPAQRPLRDLDLLIVPDEAGRVSEIMVTLGFTGGGALHTPEAKHLPAVSHGEVVVEAHLHLFDTYTAEAAQSEREFIARAWQRAEPGPVPGLVALSPTDTLLHLILHAVLDHQFNNGPLLIADMQALIGTGRIDWTTLWDDAVRLDALRACQLALGIGQALAEIEVHWGRHAPPDLRPAEIEQVTRLMLVDMQHRAAVGWPGQLLRQSPRAWLGEIPHMLRRRRRRQAADAGSIGNPGLFAMLAHALGPEGRRSIADAVRVAMWLRRKS